MKKEITIILEDNNSFKKGNCFENLVRNILETQRYDVHSDINYTGMEIDLIANHKDRNETIYVECKAKEKVSSDEISKFAFNVQHKKVNNGLFIRTKELAHQARGLVEEMKTDSDKRYENLTFFEPEKIINLLQDSGFIQKQSTIDESQIGKEILAVTYFGDLYILILKDSLVSIPTKAVIINADGKGTRLKQKEINILKKQVLEIADLEIVQHDDFIKEGNDTKFKLEQKTIDIESISEVQESENWYDYLPASTQHFVGRDEVRTEILHFFDRVQSNSSQRRIFYLTGKSGWGKSSLVAELRGRTRNKFYKNKYYVTAIDSRSALSSNFVALAFERLIRNAVRDLFIEKDLFTKNISFNSSYDILESESIKALFKNLNVQGKVLILIFDQFEDVFRKKGLFKAFYKFLTDTTDSGINLIVGFSWKTEILIPSENEAYHYWQQSKEQAVHFTVPEFGSKEINQLINQLENSIGKIDNSLKRRIVESSQGFPWLVKKLCIHVYDQVKSGKKKQELLDENLNFQFLFSKDLEALTDEEIKYLKYIAQRAFDGNFFEASEVNDIIPENIINSLRDDKRLIIRSGLNYNIYWDVFRDYLVTGNVPEIGESYIIRSSPNSSQEIFLLFSKNTQLTSKEIQKSLKKNVTIQTIENCIIDLRSLGVLKKTETEDSFELTSAITNISYKGFREFITERLKSNTVYLKAKKIKGAISNEQIIKVLKDIFKGYSFQDRTWKTYSNYFLNWFDFSDLDISNKVILIGKGKSKKVTFYKNIEKKRKETILRNSPDQIVQAVKRLDAQNLDSLPASILRDLALLDLIIYDNEYFSPKQDLLRILNTSEIVCGILATNCLNLLKIKLVYDYVLVTRKKITANDIISNCSEVFDKSLKKSSKQIYATGILKWAHFCKKHVVQK